MASNYTSSYNLNQWSASDRVLRTEFNADNAKIDAALAGKASASSVSGLQNALNSLQTTVGQHTAALSGKGNCQLYVASYTGTGRSEAANPNSLTFPTAPEVVYIGKGGNWLVLVQGEASTWAMGSSGGTGAVTVSWSGKTVRWYSTNARAQMNESGSVYKAIALMKAS